jgi:hypothetical protein
VQNVRASLPYAVNATETEIVVRCPYCVSAYEFKPMAAAGDGRFACCKCGHLAIPADKNFRCTCRKCFESRLLNTRR